MNGFFLFSHFGLYYETDLKYLMPVHKRMIRFVSILHSLNIDIYEFKLNK